MRENECKRSARAEKREEEEEEQTLSPFNTRLRLVSSKRKHQREDLTTRDIFESFFLIIRRLSVVVAFVIACSCGVEDVLLKREFRV